MWISRESNYQSLEYDVDGNIVPPARYVFDAGRIGEDLFAGVAYSDRVDIMNNPSYGQYINNFDSNGNSLKMDGGKFDADDAYAVYNTPRKVGTEDSFLSPTFRNWGTYNVK
tara:strand:+ start:2063 stop:2398 length:336 start_codon:yes stop_codon:yes gene_type:complete